MNSIIAKYMEQVGISPWQVFPSDMQKFAELIVRECVMISRTSTDGFSAAKRMEEHFGVENA